MFYPAALGFVAGMIGGLLAYFSTSFFSKRLKTTENSPTLKGMPIPGRGRVQKRTPKALTDLMAYQNEIREQGENRG